MSTRGPIVWMLYGIGVVCRVLRTVLFAACMQTLHCDCRMARGRQDGEGSKLQPRRSSSVEVGKPCTAHSLPRCPSSQCCSLPISEGAPLSGNSVRHSGTRGQSLVAVGFRASLSLCFPFCSFLLHSWTRSWGG